MSKVRRTDESKYRIAEKKSILAIIESELKFIEIGV